MTSTISHIGSEITSIISTSKKITPKISEQERINNFLDSINSLRSKISDRSRMLEKLDDLFTQLTWLDIKDEEEEKLLKELIDKSKTFHIKTLKDFISMKRSLWQENICRAEITAYKDALDDFEDSVFEVEEIFFTLRKNGEFNFLLNSL